MTAKKCWIAPSLLACDLARIGEEVRAVEEAGADVLHFDVMDGHFVPNLTFGLPVIEKIRPLTKLPIDAHLMVTNADQFISEYAAAGCNWISVHVEACPHLHRTLQKIREAGAKPGVAINPGTALSSLDGILDDVDYILVMSVNPGFGGQSYIQNATDRVSELKKKIGGRNILIEIDGGIKKDNFAKIIQAGVDVAVMGTGIFGQKNYSQLIKELRASVRA